MTTLLLLSFFCAVMAGVSMTGYWLMNRSRASVDFAGNSKDAMTSALRSLGERLPQIDAGSSSLDKLLNSAGYRWPGALQTFNGITYATAAIIAVVAFGIMLSRGGGILEAFVTALAGAGVGYMLPKRFLESKVRRRMRAVSSGLPVAMDLLVLSVEAGQSFDQAVYDAGRELREAYPELAQEFNTIYLSLRASVSRAEVFREFAGRNKEPDVAKLAGLLIDSDRYGTSLGPALRSHARYLRIRRRQTAQEAARKVGVKLVFPIFFLIFPSVLLVTLGPAVIQIMSIFGDLAGK